MKVVEVLKVINEEASTTVVIFFKFIDMEAITNQVLDSFTFDEKSIA